jgi:hypothetical protein
MTIHCELSDVDIEWLRGQTVDDFLGDIPSGLITESGQKISEEEQ